MYTEKGNVRRSKRHKTPQLVGTLPHSPPLPDAPYPLIPKPEEVEIMINLTLRLCHRIGRKHVIQWKGSILGTSKQADPGLGCDINTRLTLEADTIGPHSCGGLI